MTENSIPEPRRPHDAYVALRVPDFALYLCGNLAALLGAQMQLVAVGWELYERTRQPLHLGLIGLVQVVPVIALALPAGQMVDRLERRRVVMGALAVILACSVGLAVVSVSRAEIWWVYLLLFGNGVARAFLQPAKTSLVPLLVPRSMFPNAVTWSTSAFQLAAVVGPLLGGMLIGLTHAATPVYVTAAVLSGVFLLLAGCIQPRPAAVSAERVGLASLLAGLVSVWRKKVILGAISLDMFAVLLGGATALLPIFAKDILHVGAQGLGWLRGAPAVGALLTSFLLAHRPPRSRTGPLLLGCVAGFGVATVVFGLARSFWLAAAMLLVAGALDMVSVVIRHTLIQLRTPDFMRGRVSAVNGVFIGISNELGEFESGFVAHLFHDAQDLAFGPTVAVVSGGLGTILVVVIACWLFPEVRRCRTLDEAEPERL